VRANFLRNVSVHEGVARPVDKAPLFVVQSFHEDIGNGLHDLAFEDDGPVRIQDFDFESVCRPNNLSSVDFPAPFGPTSTVFCPRSSVRFRARKTVSSP
jgi:hypothetical protein